MRRESATIRPVYGVAAALAGLALSLAGCGASGSSGAASKPAAPARPAPSSSAGGALALSHMKVLTQLTQAQLCGQLSPAEATQILGGPADTPVFSSSTQMGIACQWARKDATAASPAQLYVRISTSISWADAQGMDELLHASSMTIAGHPALAVGWQPTLGWAQVDVALGGAHDPVAEYRAPTMASTLALAKTATPHILAFG